MSIIKHVTLQKIVAHDFRYDPCNNRRKKGHAFLTGEVRSHLLFTDSLNDIYMQTNKITQSVLMIEFILISLYKADCVSSLEG